MKHIKILLSIACLTILCGTTWAQSGKPTVLKGTIHGYRGQETIFFTSLNDETGRDIAVDKEGNFSMTTPIDKPCFDAMMNIGQYFMRFYVEPGGTHIFDIDLADESKYTITGTHARENAVWKRYIFDFFRMLSIEEDLTSHAQNFQTYKAYLDLLRKSLMDEAEATQNHAFVVEIQKNVQKSYLYNLYYYALFSARQTGKVADDPKFDEWLASRQWGAEDEEALTQYGMFGTAISYNFADVDRLIALQTLKKIIPNAGILNNIATSVIMDYISRGGRGDRDKVYAYYKTICTDQRSLARVEQAFDGSKFLAEGSMAPDFTMADTEGREFKFSDLRGKVVYVDVWATWCGPCKVQIPYFAELAHKFKDDKRITFVSISIDDNHSAWKKMLEEEKPEWLQYIVQGGGRSELNQKYQISSIPRFMLFDREGKIISVNASSPSREDMAEYLQELIDKGK